MSATETMGQKLLAGLEAAYPDAYPQKIDLVRNTALLIAMDEAAYRGASFLDDRILGPATRGAWIGLEALLRANPPAAQLRPLHFIFHTGHVGSTLVSRLLDETGCVLSLREPLPLRTLADAYDGLASDSLLSPKRFEQLFAALARLWSRGYPQTRSVVIKATSSAGRLAVPILERLPHSRAIYLNLPAEAYLATLLAGENSPLDLRGHAPGRLRRLVALTGASEMPLHTLSLGELAALGWLVESTALQEARARFPERVRALDFERFLASVPQAMTDVLEHFGLPTPGDWPATVARSPVLNRYSKAPELAFSAQTRGEVLRDSRSRNRLEIRRGLEWLEALAGRDARIAQIMQAGGRGGA
jgi:hypothetical protein